MDVSCHLLLMHALPTQVISYLDILITGYIFLTALPRQATIVDGTLGIGSQYHFHMETQTCIAWPSEDGEFELRSSCQGMGFVQNVVASALNIPKNKINVVVRKIVMLLL